MNRSISFSCKSLEVACELIENNPIDCYYWNKHTSKNKETYFKCSAAKKCPAKLEVSHHDSSSRITIYSFDQHDHTDDNIMNSGANIKVLVVIKFDNYTLNC